jgi:two-component system chemotaxis response regulator CheB
LVVDDSTLTREALRRALELDPGLTVVAEAKTGEEALSLARSVQPDLITMDLNMPGMGGLKAIEVIMRERPTAIVVISEKSSERGVDLNYEALSRGALELVPKSSVFGVEPGDVKRFGERLRLLAASRVDVEVKPSSPPPAIPVSKEPPLLLGIGASTGGPRALVKLLSELPKDFPLPIAVVQHMAEDFFDSFVRFLADASKHEVELAQPGVLMQPGRIYVAPPRKELFVKEGLTMRLLPPPPEALISPSVDSLFFSMASGLKGRSIGVLLTGMGDDGAQGLLRMRRMGARTVAQDRASSAVFGMPRAAQEVGAAEVVLPLDDMAKWIVETVSRPGEVVPVPQPLPSPPVAPGRPRASTNSYFGKKRILIVDDDVNAMTGAKRALEAGGYEVTLLDNALMLASTLRKTPVDLVLFETELSTVKGSLVLNSLREHQIKHSPIWLLSKLSGAGLAERAKECGAEGAIEKTSKTLLREVHAALAVKTPAN